MALSRKGFTLVELMIALVAGSFAVAGVYYLNGVSSRALSQQMSVSDAQLSLRSAMEQVRRDVARAGYLAAPNSNTLYNCAGTVVAGSADVTQQAFQAVRVRKDGSLSYQNPSGTQVAALLGTNKVAADDLTMYGNFATADAYLSDPDYPSASVITLQTTSEAFRRSFFTPGATNATAATANSQLFTDTFAAGRMLRVENGGRFYFRNIQASAWPANGLAQISLSTGLPDCFQPTAWTAVAPVTRIHYGLESDLGANFTRIVGDYNGAPGMRRPLLVRREESVVDGSLIAGSARVVLDYAVEFGIDAIANNAATLDVRPSWAYAIGNTAINALNAKPEFYRSLVVTMATRAIEADTRLPAVDRAVFNQANALNSPLLTFQVFDPTAKWAAVPRMNARVRSLRSEIFLQNL